MLGSPWLVHLSEWTEASHCSLATTAREGKAKTDSATAAVESRRRVTLAHGQRTRSEVVAAGTRAQGLTDGNRGDSE